MFTLSVNNVYYTIQIPSSRQTKEFSSLETNILYMEHSRSSNYSVNVKRYHLFILTFITSNNINYLVESKF